MALSLLYCLVTIFTFQSSAKLLSASYMSQTYEQQNQTVCKKFKTPQNLTNTELREC